jgi:GT2 family glycosyltransferase
MNAPPTLSVVVPTYQRCASVQRLLAALGRQSLPAEDFEVVVVDDGSTDGTGAALQAMRTPYALRVQVQPNRGRASACNAGVRAGRGEIVLLLDDDMEPTAGLLAAHRDAHAGYPRRGVLGAVPVPVGAASSATARWVGTRFNHHLTKLAQPGHPIDVRSFYSGNFSIRRAVLAEVGGFDETFREYGNEDVELAVRLLGAGVALVYNKQAAAIQHYEKDFACLARDHLAKGRTAVLCASKHPDTVARLRLGTFGHGSRRWRLLRNALLAAARCSERVPGLLIRLIARAERPWPNHAVRLYAPVLDLCFWIGVHAALREHGDGRLRSLIRGSANPGAEA